MYRVIVVNVDEETHASITTMFKYTILNMHIVASFFSIREATEYVKNNRVDVVITDILNNGKSALELIQYIFENKMKVKVLMLSGYRHLDYAQRAIEYGVENCLLKPVRQDEFVTAMTAIKLALDKQNTFNSSHTKQLLPILHEQFFYELFFGETQSREAVLAKAKQLSLDTDFDTRPCAMIEIYIFDYESYIEKRWKYEKETLYTAFKNLLNDSERFYYSLVYKNSARMFFGVHSKNSMTMDAFVETLKLECKEKAALAFELFGLVIFISQKQSFSDLFSLSKNKIDYSLEKMKHNCSFEALNSNYLSDKMRLLVSEIKMHNLTQAFAIIDNYIEQIEGFELADITLFLNNILHILCEHIFDEETMVHMKKKSDSLLFFSYKDIFSIKLQTHDIITEFVSCLKDHSHRADNQIINKAKQYIVDNCQNDISLDDVAEYVYLTPVYLSRFFKQKTGENFSDFVIKARMERAIKIFKSGGYKIYEVSRMVGYKNTKYFTKLFKNYTGYAPRAYSRMLLLSGYNESI